MNIKSEINRNFIFIRSIKSFYIAYGGFPEYTGYCRYIENKCSTGYCCTEWTNSSWENPSCCTYEQYCDEEWCSDDW